MLRNLYILGLGLLLGITATATISFATIAPKMPQYPTELSVGALTPQTDAVGMPLPGAQDRYMTEQKSYDKQMKVYNAESSKYNFNINLMRVGIAVGLLIVASLLFGRVALFPEAIGVGGVLLLLGMSSSTLVSFYTFDTTMSGDGTFRVSAQQLASLYAATVIAGAGAYWTLRVKKKAS